MTAESRFRGIVIPIGLCMLGCATTVGRLGDVSVISQTHPAPARGCPYANVYVAVSADGSRRDEKIAERVRLAYSDFLGQQGFSVVGDPEEAYWSAFSMVGLSRRIESNFAWTLYMMARHDLQGTIRTPYDFVEEGQEESELSGYMLLREIRLLELEPQARRAAVDTAGALLPHANRMCAAWSMELESLRQELVKEMMRVRRERAENSPRKRLKIEPVDEGRTFTPVSPAAEGS